MTYQRTLESAWEAHLAPRTPNAPTIVSTFAGAGGSSLGYSMSGYRELLAVEWDAHAVETFRINFPEVAVFHGDIAQLTAAEALERTGLSPGELDVFDGSPPCQGFSSAGRRMLDDPRNALFREYVRLLQGFMPKTFVMENVAGMVRGKMLLVFAEAMQALKSSGYRVSARILDAAYFGVPQNRRRIIFIGVREDLGIQPSHPIAQQRPIPLRAVCPDVKASRSMRINPWIPAHARPVCTITKTPYRDLFLTDSGTRAPNREELKALGSFPPGFRLDGALDDAWNRIGNSVPPLFMRAIATHIRINILEAVRDGSQGTGADADQAEAASRRDAA